MADDLLPGIEKEPYTNDMIAGLHYLAEWYLDTKQPDLAQEMYITILGQVPDDPVSLECYLELKGK